VRDHTRAFLARIIHDAGFIGDKLLFCASMR
jgi:hypothetical protein